jgi:hypothetical protein
VSVAFKKDLGREIVTLRVSTVFPFTVGEVEALITSVGRRKDWDPKFHKGHKLDSLEGSSDVVHMVFKSCSSPYKYRDFCLLRCQTDLEHGTRLLGERSIIHSTAPEDKDNVRAVMYPSGWVLTPLTEEEAKAAEASVPENPALSAPSGKAKKDSPFCLLTFVAQMDREAVSCFFRVVLTAPFLFFRF